MQSEEYDKQDNLCLNHTNDNINNSTVKWLVNLDVYGLNLHQRADID